MTVLKVITDVEISRVTYALAVGVELIHATIHYDHETENPLYERVNKLPEVFETDYSGHFGHFIYVTTELAPDSKKWKDTVAEIDIILQKYMEDVHNYDIQSED